MIRAGLGHPLRGQMHRLSYWQIETRLEEYPPTREEAVELGLEESKRVDDRPEVYWALGRTMLPFLCALLMGCATPGPAPVYAFEARPLIAEAWYRLVFEHMEECSGKDGDFDAITFLVVRPGLMGPFGETVDGTIMGTWSRPARIYLDARFVFDIKTLGHEFGHLLWQLGNDAHLDPIFLRCTGLL